MSIAVARTVGGLEELDDEINAVGSEATLVPLDLRDRRRHRPAGRRASSSAGSSSTVWSANAGVRGRRSRRCRMSSPRTSSKALAAQRHRQLPADPLVRSAAAPGRTPGARCFVSSIIVTLGARLLGPLCRDQGGARRPGARVYAGRSGRLPRRPRRTCVLPRSRCAPPMRAPRAYAGRRPGTRCPCRPGRRRPKLIDMIAPGFTENRVLFYDCEKSAASLKPARSARHQHLVDAAAVEVEHLEPPAARASNVSPTVGRWLSSARM